MFDFCFSYLRKPKVNNHYSGSGEKSFIVAGRLQTETIPKEIGNDWNLNLEY